MQRAAGIAILWLLAASPILAQVVVSGRVVDEEGAPLSNARISARQGGGTPITAETGPAGIFHLHLLQAGKYLVSAQRTGFFQLVERPIEFEAGMQPVTLILNANREVFQSVEVGENSSPVDPAQTERE